MTVLSKQPGNGSAVIHCIATTTTNLSDVKCTPLAGNTNFANDNPTAMKIVGVAWAGTWAIARGANTVLNLSGSGQWDLTNLGATVDIDKTASLVATLTGSGSLIIRVRKEGTVT